MKRQLFAPFLLAVLTLLGATAVRAQEAATVVQSTTAAVMERVKNDKDALRADPAKMFSLVSDMIFPHFDFEVMSKFVVGTPWASTEAAKQQAFIAEFRRLLVRTYATALLEYSDQTIEYPASEPTNNPKTAIVRQNVNQAVGKVLPVMYRLHDKSGEWKVYDVEVDGISLVKTFKSAFAQTISEGGLDRLIEDLKAKNKDLGA